MNPAEGLAMPRTRATSLPAYMRTALAFLPRRALGKTTALVEPLPLPAHEEDMISVEQARDMERTILQAEINDLRQQMELLSTRLKEKQLRLMQLAGSVAIQSSDAAPPIIVEEPTSSLKVQEFPPEVLQRVFHHVIQSDPSARLALSQVCFYWRTCALSCPPLWADIPIPIRPSYSEGFIAHTTLSFQRAKASSLHLRMTYELGDSVGPSSSAGPDYRLLDLALSRQHLWASLELDLRDQVWTAAMLDRLADGLDGAHCPRLKTIDWRTGMKASPRFELILSRLLAGAENLDRLTLESHVDLVLQKPIPTLRSLTIQLGRRPPVSQLIPFLQALPGLQELSLPSLDHDSQFTPNDSLIVPAAANIIVLPALARLTVDISDDAADAVFLRYLVLPGLRQLVIRPQQSLDAKTDLVSRVVREKGWPVESLQDGSFTSIT
ncbi:hypothetical protein CALVIDRAFT_123223 [Calocera viscosa TUFC12733]|uniref:F-box domain-containing protein n=1 Tax=Calocera viscosa (strain TUFC12733) TaxID=1330018 RepID=A0A167RNB6_CALVF|nr:hypothetical protein CALVIDRAFT_123223 [Calocera viscosa TUFC12733]